DGVRVAVDRFAEMLPRGETLVIPRTIETQFAGIDHLDAYTERALERYGSDFIDLPALPYQSEKLMLECAEMYLLTGREEYAETYARMLRRWMDEYYRYTLERQINTPKYMVPWILVSFASIEDSPLIPNDAKLDLTNLIYDYCSRLARDTGRIAGLRPGRLMGTGMHEVSESIIYGSEYLRKHYPELDFEDIDYGVEQVMIGQETIAASNGFIDNNGGYTAFYPQTAMRLALITGNHAFFESGAARRWMQYSMLVTNSWASTFFSSSVSPDANLHARHCMPAWYYNDPGYLWFSNWREGRSEYHPQMTEDSFDYWVWTYLPKIEPNPPVETMVGLNHMTLHELNYRQLESQGRFVNVPRERTFHQLAMREGLEREDQYLRLDGINDGITSGGDGNSIAAVSDGRSWLTGTGKWGGGRNMKWHNTALVLRQGLMSDRLVALADLHLASEFPNSAFVRSVMHEYHGVDWARNIAWIRGKYWVVLDQFVAREPDEFSIMCQWYTGGDSVDEQRRSTVTVRDHSFVLQAAGGSMPFVTYLEDGRSIVRQAVHGHFDAGDEAIMAHLMYGHANEAPENYSIDRVAENTVRVNEPERQVLIGVGPLGEPEPMVLLEGQLSATCAMFAMAPDELALAGLTELQAGGTPLLEAERPIDLLVDLTTGSVTATADEPTRLRLGGPEVAEMRLGVDEPRELTTLEAGALTALAGSIEAAIAAAGTVAEEPAEEEPAEEQMAEYPAALAEQWRFMIPDGDQTTVQVIEHADLTGDGVSEILLGTDDGRLFALNADGGESWQVQFEPHPDQPGSRGQDRAAINDIAIADFGEGPRILVASDSQYLHCLDADGTEMWRFTGAGVELTNQAPGLQGPGRHREGDGEMMTVEVVDLDGDGVLDILAGSKTFMHGSRRVYGTLWRLDPSGEMVWHLFQSAGTVTNIATFDPDGDGRRLIYFGTGGGTYGGFAYLCDHEGTFLDNVRGPHGETYVAAGRLGADDDMRLLRLEQRDGAVYVHDAEEPWERRWMFRAGGLSAVGPELVDLTGDGSLEILVGSDGGSIFCLRNADDPVLWTSTIGEPVSAITVGRLSPDSEQIVTGSWVGGLTVVAADGSPVAYAQIEAPIDSVAIFDANAGHPGLLVAGSSDGAVTAFNLQ
ncbi:MAG: PQQ-binding-like beta-propeller repeat protein, partial [Armatimonadota bacterium]